MQTETILPKYLEAILSGNRNAARDSVRKLISTGVKSQAIYQQVLFPAMEKVQSMYREDAISPLIRNLAVRINRFITDQIQAQLMPKEDNGKIAVIVCAEAETEELGGQMCSDLLESEGWKVFFLGGGVAEDDITEFIGTIDPNLLVIYGSTPSGVPLTRQLITRIREIGLCPLMNVIVTGGIFNRVEGLWEEIQADMYASNPVDVVNITEDANQKLHVSQDPLAPKRRRRLANGPISIN